MNNHSEHLDALRDIKQMMEKSSRFISLSGFSGIAAGSCALIGAAFAYPLVYENNSSLLPSQNRETSLYDPAFPYLTHKGGELLLIALLTFTAAFLSAFIFTYLRSKKTNTPVWNKASKRLTFHVLFPLLAGGIYLLKLLQLGTLGMIAPGCLIFYGLALLNASKYTLKEIQYLGISEILLGVLTLFFTGGGLYFWAIGFGLLHIFYGTIMWWKYERGTRS